MEVILKLIPLIAHSKEQKYDQMSSIELLNQFLKTIANTINTINFSQHRSSHNRKIGIA